jgi:hypothetical protein
MKVPFMARWRHHQTHSGGDASYAILALTGELEVEFRFIDYDFETAAAAVESVGLPRGFAEALRLGKG